MTEMERTEILHQGLTMGGEVILTKKSLDVKSGGEIKNHWYNSPEKTGNYSMSMPLEKIDNVIMFNNRKNERYRKYCEKLKLDYKRRVAIVASFVKNPQAKDPKWKVVSFCFAPQTSPEHRKQEAQRKFSDAMIMAAGGVGSLYEPDWQLRTAQRWVEWIKEAIQNRKIALLQEGGLTMAWKCAYCNTLNDAEKERCSHCGSPRRK